MEALSYTDRQAKELCGLGTSGRLAVLARGQGFRVATCAKSKFGCQGNPDSAPRKTASKVGLWKQGHSMTPPLPLCTIDPVFTLLLVRGG